MELSLEDRTALIRDKYDSHEPAPEILDADLARLAGGEPLAYVIGWIPFLGLRIRLDSHPLIPRPETEYWTHELMAHLRERFGDSPFTFLDLCAGSGAIGLAILKEFPRSRVTFAELVPEHIEQIKENIIQNGLDASRTEVRESNVFETLYDQTEMLFNIVATNPPYIPADRVLETSVISFEPQEALFAGSDGLEIIRRIALDAPAYLMPDAELWMECDISNIEWAKNLLLERVAARAEIRNDQYGRPRFVVAYYE
jgi:release factor glutamine methyltransferase